MQPRVIVVGAGWSGAVAARALRDHGLDVEVLERAPHVGGHSRVEVLNGVVYEPNGAHIFHTSNERVAEYVQQYGIRRPYEHKVVTEVYLHPDDDEAVQLSWPPQVSELRELPLWPVIEQELAALPEQATGDNFADYVESLMGPTLYQLFIHEYTVKQWGRDPHELSSSFAPKRVELRDDGYRRLFRDRWEFFPEAGVNSAIEAVLAPVPVTCGVEVGVDDAAGMAWDALVVTAPLDRFVGQDGDLAWRGITMRSRYEPTDELDGTVTAAYVVNHPSIRVPFTRTVETKHATGQRIGGTVVSEEYPGAPHRHYPVPTVDRVYERRNEEFKGQIRQSLERPVFFCGRLANYLYINQDEAIEQGLRCAEEVVASFA